MPKKKASKKAKANVLTMDERKEKIKGIMLNLNKTEAETEVEIKNDYNEVRSLVQLYLNLKAQYEYKTPKVLFSLKQDSGNYKLWLRVNNRIKDSKVDQETYLKAYFWYYNKCNFGTPKALNFLAIQGRSTPEKILPEFMNHTQALDKSVSDLTIGGRCQPTVVASLQSKDSKSQAKLGNLMKSFNKSEEEILLKFAKKGVADFYFDPTWLSNNNTYRKLVELGKL